MPEVHVEDVLSRSACVCVKNVILRNYVRGRLYARIHSQVSHTSVPGPWKKTGPGQPALPLPGRIKSVGWVDKLLG